MDGILAMFASTHDRDRNTYMAWKGLLMWPSTNPSNGETWFSFKTRFELACLDLFGFSSMQDLPPALDKLLALHMYHAMPREARKEIDQALQVRKQVTDQQQHHDAPSSSQPASASAIFSKYETPVSAFTYATISLLCLQLWSRAGTLSTYARQANERYGASFERTEANRGQARSSKDAYGDQGRGRSSTPAPTRKQGGKTNESVCLRNPCDHSCTHCHRNSHRNADCFTLHPELRPKNNTGATLPRNQPVPNMSGPTPAEAAQGARPPTPQGSRTSPRSQERVDYSNGGAGTKNKNTKSRAALIRTQAQLFEDMPPAHTMHPNMYSVFGNQDEEDEPQDSAPPTVDSNRK